MKIVFHFITAVLLVCLLAPLPVRAGGDMGKSYEIGEKYFARKDYKTALKLYQKALRQKDVRAEPRIKAIEELLKREPQRSTAAPRPSAKPRPTAAPRPVVIPRSTAAPRLTVTHHPTDPLAEGKSLFKNGKYREAEVVLLQAVAIEESNPEAHFYLGDVYTALEDYDKAAAEYKKAQVYYRPQPVPAQRQQ